MLQQSYNLIKTCWLLLVMSVMVTGCTTPPTPSVFSFGLYKMRTLPKRIANDDHEDEDEDKGCENCEGCTKCKPCRPDPVSSLAHHYSPFMDDINSKKNAEHCAFETLKDYSEQTGESLSCEFEDGFVQAYLDLADGYSGETPAVPSPHYWHARYRIPEGQARVQRWFEGYQIGALNAEQDGIGHSKVATSMGEPQNVSSAHQAGSGYRNSYGHQNFYQQ